MCWNDWFRDENLQAPKTIDTTSGNDTTTYSLLNRGKKHDYFTSALPWPQKGADVTIPLGTSAPIMANVNGTETQVGVNDVNNVLRNLKNDGSNFTYVKGNVASTAGTELLEADLTDATAATINQLRLAFATQKFLEIQARGGSRYIEVIKNHFNVTSPRRS